MGDHHTLYSVVGGVTHAHWSLLLFKTAVLGVAPFSFYNMVRSVKKHKMQRRRGDVCQVCSADTCAKIP
ncbi:Hypothetical predicted protein [Octopus vulgaris]|uniref:Uncharacterized protein n=1 Tax=Octopus vulgaris TaxID=6645 RepID=A0AA36BVX5_OCTVU|nr:Hypothetical predicted protein [Octopus vulgaris]